MKRHQVVLQWSPTSTFKDTLWVLRRDEPLVHLFVDILLIAKHVLVHDVSLES